MCEYRKLPPPEMTPPSWSWSVRVVTAGRRPTVSHSTRCWSRGIRPTPSRIDPLFSHRCGRTSRPAARRTRRCAQRGSHSTGAPGDCSPSNTLFRRSAGAFAAYMVDVETAERTCAFRPAQPRPRHRRHEPVRRDARPSRPVICLTTAYRCLSATVEQLAERYAAPLVGVTAPRGVPG